MLRYIFGKAGTGKTTLCADEIVNCQMRNPEAPESLLYIVPEQFSLESERLLLERTEGRGLLRGQVLSFNRLAYNVFREQGRPGERMLEEAGKSLLVRKAVMDSEGKLSYYKSAYALKSRGFVSSIGGMITEFYQYGITPEILTQAAGAIGSEYVPLKLRLGDLGIIYSAYLKHMGENYISGDSALDALADRISESEFLEGAVIWLDGFKSFTPQEYKVLSALMRKCSSVSAAMVLDSMPEDGTFNGFFPDCGEYDAFREVKYTVNKLSRLANELGTPLGGHVFLKEPRRYAKFPEGQFIAEHFFDSPGTAGAKRYEGLLSGVFLTQCENPNSEIEFAAREITALTRDSGYRYSDIGVIIPDTGIYAKKLKNTFDKYGIALFIDDKKDLLSHPLAELCRGLLAAAQSGYTYENMFRVIKTGLLPLERATADELENYVLANGIRYGGWEREWTYGFGDDNEAGERINGARARVVTVFESFTGSVSRKGQTARELCIALYRFVESAGCRERLSALIDAVRTEGNFDAAQFHLRMWARFIEVLDKIVEILGDTVFTPAEFSEILTAGFEDAPSEFAPPTLDHVTAGDVRRSRLSAKKAVFVLGLNEGLIPARVTGEGLLSDSDREILKESGVELAGTFAQKTLEERLNIYQILAKPSERLYLSYMSGDGGGKAAYPSQIVTELRRKLPGLKPSERRGAGDEIAVTSAEPMIAEIYNCIRNTEPGEILPDAYRIAYTLLRNSERFGGIINRLDRVMASDSRSRRLPYDDISELYREGGTLRLKASATKLESYINCPFMYYSRYNLSLSERKLYEVESYDVGNVLHMVVDKYTDWLKEQGDTGSISLEQQYNEAMRIVRETAGECMNAILLSSERYKYFTKRLGDISWNSIQALTEHLKRGDFKILSTETEFSGSGAIVLELGENKEMELTGRIDRIDIMTRDGVDYVKIIDYKSGEKKFSFADMYYGLQLQLFAYLRAYLLRNGKTAPAAALYFNIGNPMLDYKEGLDAGSNRGEHINKYKMTGVVSADKNILRSLDKELSRRSGVIPAGINANGEPSGTSVLNAGEFDALVDAAVKKMADTGAEILSGNIQAKPVLYRNMMACRYCEYNAVCGRDARVGGSAHRLRRIKEADARNMLLEGENKEH